MLLELALFTTVAIKLLDAKADCGTTPLITLPSIMMFSEPPSITNTLPGYDVDVVGGINLKKHFGEGALSIFVMPPSMRALEERLKGRGTDSEERIEKRLAKAKQELITADQFDYVVLNDELEKAVGAAKLIVKKFLDS